MRESTQSNKRRGVSIEDQLSPKFFGDTRELCRRQSPAADGILVVACSDFPGDPFCLFGNPDNVYVLQNPGNLVEDAHDDRLEDGNQIELILKLWSISQIVVCGHVPCRYVVDFLTRQPSCDRLDSDVTRMAEGFAVDANQRSRPRVEENVAKRHLLSQLVKLVNYPSVRVELDAGRLRLHGVLHCLNGLCLYDAQLRRFLRFRD